MKLNFENIQNDLEKNTQFEIIQGFIEHLIINAPKINEGNNGIIKKIDANQLPVELISYLNKLNPNFFKDREQFALKIIKIYNKGVGEHEYNMQKMAREIIQTKSQPNIEYANIPEPLFFSEIAISDDEAKKSLQRDGMAKFSDKIEILIMDLISGDDLATIIYKKVLKHAQNDPNYQNKLTYSKANYDEFSTTELQSEITRLLDFRRPGGKNHDENQRIFEEQKIQQENAEKIINFLKKNNITLNKHWFETINSTIQLLNSEGLYHRDLHERNIMIHEDAVHIIDFGSAKIFPKNASNDEIYNETTGRRPQDQGLLEMWRRCFSTIDEDKATFSTEIVRELENFKAQLIKRGLFPEQELILLTNDELDKNLSNLAKNITKSTMGDMFEKAKLTLVWEKLKDNPIKLEEYIKEQLKTAVSLTWKNTLSKILIQTKKSANK